MISSVVATTRQPLWASHYADSFFIGPGFFFLHPPSLIFCVRTRFRGGNAGGGGARLLDFAIGIRGCRFQDRIIWWSVTWFMWFDNNFSLQYAPAEVIL